VTQALLIMDAERDRRPVGAPRPYLTGSSRPSSGPRAGLLVVLVRVAFGPGIPRCPGATRASPRWPRTPG
jgi:hypothetical protein